MSKTRGAWTRFQQWMHFADDVVLGRRCRRGFDVDGPSGVGRVTAQDIDRFAARATLAADARDVRAARDSLSRLLALSPSC